MDGGKFAKLVDTIVSVSVSVLFFILSKNGWEGVPYVVPPAIYLLLHCVPTPPQHLVLPPSLCYRKRHLSSVLLSFFCLFVVSVFLTILLTHDPPDSVHVLSMTFMYYLGPSIKDVGIFLAVFDTPLPHVGILTLIYLTSTF